MLVCVGKAGGKYQELTTSTRQVVRHSNSDIEILCLGLREPICSRNVVCDGQVL